MDCESSSDLGATLAWKKKTLVIPCAGRAEKPLHPPSGSRSIQQLGPSAWKSTKKRATDSVDLDELGAEFQRVGGAEPGQKEEEACLPQHGITRDMHEHLLFSPG